MNDSECEQRARIDLALNLGCVFLVSAVTGYRGDDQADVCLDPPARMRVVGGTPWHWTCDDWLDPDWDMDLVDPHPQLEGMGAFWVGAVSYNPKRGESQVDKDVVFENSIWNRLRRWRNRRLVLRILGDPDKKLPHETQ
jgi:hypothetical protein